MTAQDPIKIEPCYTSADRTGRCVKCAAESSLDHCLRILLNDPDNKEAAARYQTLFDFLSSSESLNLRNEAERLLSDGRQVTIIIERKEGRDQYRLVSLE
jgi:hypothetical protein